MPVTTNVHTYIHTCILYPCLVLRRNIHTYMHTYIYIHTYIFIHTYIYIYTHTHFVFIFLHDTLWYHAGNCLHTYTYTCIRTRIQTWNESVQIHLHENLIWNNYYLQWIRMNSFWSMCYLNEFVWIYFKCVVLEMNKMNSCEFVSSIYW
jgi:hypothetical protein